MTVQQRIGSGAVALVQIALTAFLIVWIVVLLRPVGWRGQWEWAVAAQRLAPVPLIAGIGVLVVAVVGAALLARRRLEVAWRITLVVGATVWPLFLYSSVPNGWFNLVSAAVTDVSCEYFGEAYELRDPAEYCISYVDRQRASAHHLATHPPGAVLTYWAVIQAARATGLAEAARPITEGLTGARAWNLTEVMRTIPTSRPIAPSDVGLPLVVAFVFSVLGALTVLPVAAAGRVAWGPEAAFPAGLIAATVPGISMLFQCLDTVLTLLVAVAVWLTLKACERPVLVFVAGLVLGVGLFISFGVLAAVAVCGLTAVCGGWRRPAGSWRARSQSAILPAACLALGVAVVWAMLVLFLRQDPLSMAALSAQHHRSVIAGFRREYGIWVWMNLVEFAAFLGPALAVLVVTGALAARRRGGPAACLALGTLATLALLDLSGTVRAEVGRIWLFFAGPLSVLAAGACCCREEHPPRLWLTVALQVAALLALVATVHPVVRPY